MNYVRGAENENAPPWDRVKSRRVCWVPVPANCMETIIGKLVFLSSIGLIVRQVEEWFSDGIYPELYHSAMFIEPPQIDPMDGMPKILVWYVFWELYPPPNLMIQCA